MSKQPSKILSSEMQIKTLDKQWRVKLGVWNVTCYNTTTTIKATSQFTLIITNGSSLGDSSPLCSMYTSKE